MTDEVTVDEVVDAKGLMCPMPVLEAKKALKGMPAGAVLKIFTTDPAAKEDFETLCRTGGHEMLGFEDGAEFQTSLIKKAA